MLKLGLPLQDGAEKTVHEVETHWFCIKEKAKGEVVSTKVMLIACWDMKRPIMDFLEKAATVNIASYYQLLW